MYGDSIYEFNLDKMIIEHHDSNAFLSMALLSYKTNLKYGFIDLDGSNNTNGLNGRVTRWREKPEITGLINIGCYVIEPEFFKLIPKSSDIWNG